MSSCIVYLDNYYGQYYPGADVKGRVVCSFGHSEDIREIRLKLSGAEHTSWMGTESYYDSQSKSTKTRSVQYTGNNTFFALQTSLTGSGTIGPGRTEYLFSLPLPKKLPGSFQNKYGWIKYTLKAKVDRPFAFDYKDTKSLEVVAPIDFNTMIQDLDLQPVSYSDEKMICCCCCATGPITMNIHFEKEAFVPGEAANVTVEITNMSNESIESLNVKMGMTVSSKTTSPKSAHKYDYELLATHNDSGVGAHGERTYQFQLEIPQSTVVPNFDLSVLFSQWTDIKVEAVLPGCHSNLSITNRVVMGNIPVRAQRQLPTSNQHNAVPYPSQQSNQSPSGETPYSAPAPPYASVVSQQGDASIGFSVPQPPPYHPGAVPPANAASYPPTSGPSGSPGPSAPPPENEASAPPKAELATAEEWIDLPDGSSGDDTSELLPPPSYNEAVSGPPYLHK